MSLPFPSDEPLDEDATGDPAIPDEVPAPDTDDEVKTPPPHIGEQDEDSPLDELGIPSELIPETASLIRALCPGQGNVISGA